MRMDYLHYPREIIEGTQLGDARAKLYLALARRRTIDGKISFSIESILDEVNIKPAPSNKHGGLVQMKKFLDGLMQLGYIEPKDYSALRLKDHVEISFEEEKFNPKDNWEHLNQDEFVFSNNTILLLLVLRRVAEKQKSFKTIKYLLEGYIGLSQDALNTAFDDLVKLNKIDYKTEVNKGTYITFKEAKKNDKDLCENSDGIN